MNFYLVPVMGLQSGGITGQIDILAILRKNPVAAGLLQAAAQNRVLTARRAGRGRAAVVSAALIAGRGGLGLVVAGTLAGSRCSAVACGSGLIIGSCARAAATAAAALRERHAGGQHKSDKKFLVHVLLLRSSLPVGLICLPRATWRGSINADECLETSKQCRVGLFSHRMQSCCSC